ncbi:glycosyltransferase family 2 protein [Ramlibacter sp. MAHUQ-53]|uniref:glycosyltransferase family 2 protein n=1 Tax=unclassified Ramlibacter TaxID=2617605 RepID=UPI003644F0CC
MTQPNASITFACYNQVDYTRQCVDSLVRHGFDLRHAAVVDNGSTDSTREYLQTLPLGNIILNRKNLGCGVAWNQGVLAQQAEWSVVMNNDVVVTAGWLDHLIASAREHRLDVVSPGMVEGPLDYDLDAFAADARRRMGHVVRRGARHAVCLVVHESVWERIGYFRATPSLWGFEDTLFFHELDKAGIQTGVVGSSWLHHYGSITLSALKRERGLKEKQGLSARTTYRLLGKSFLERKLDKLRLKQRQRAWREAELAEFGMTLQGERVDGQFVWR